MQVTLGICPGTHGAARGQLVQRTHRTIVADEIDRSRFADVEAVEHCRYRIATHHALFAHEVPAIVDRLRRRQLDRLDHRTQLEGTRLGVWGYAERRSHAEQGNGGDQGPPATSA